MGGGGGVREERREAVVEVGEEEDVPLCEGFEDGGLVDAVERAGLHLAYAAHMGESRKIGLAWIAGL